MDGRERRRGLPAGDQDLELAALRVSLRDLRAAADRLARCEDLVAHYRDVRDSLIQLLAADGVQGAVLANAAGVSRRTVRRAVEEAGRRDDCPEGAPTGRLAAPDTEEHTQ